MLVGLPSPSAFSHPGSTPLTYLTYLTVGWPVGSANCHILLRESAKFVCLHKCHGEKTTAMEIRCVENVWNISSQSVSYKWSSWQKSKDFHWPPCWLGPACFLMSVHLRSSALLQLLLEFSVLHRTHGGRSSGNVCSSKRLAKNPNHSKWFKVRNNLWVEVSWSRIWVDLPEFNNKHWTQNFTSFPNGNAGRDERHRRCSLHLSPNPESLGHISARASLQRH